MIDQTLKKPKSRWLMNLYFLRHLPGAFFFGLRIRTITAEKSVVEVPFRWSTKNPFKSVYFVAMTAAAELSTGVLALGAVDTRVMSMLVTRVEGEFLKKAKGSVFFECNQAIELQGALAAAQSNDSGSKLILHSTGRNQDGEMVARFSFEWSFRKK